MLSGGARERKLRSAYDDSDTNSRT